MTRTEIAVNAEPAFVQEASSPAQVAAGHARHYAALLAQEEPGTQGWQFVFGQLSAAATLANALAGERPLL